MPKNKQIYRYDIPSIDYFGIVFVFLLNNALFLMKNQLTLQAIYANLYSDIN